MGKHLRLIIATLAILAAFSLSAQQSTTVNGYTLTFNGVTYDETANTSTWSYTLVWNKAVYQQELSHLTIGFCGTAKVLDATPAGYSSGPDGSTGVFGIKWDVDPDGIPPLPDATPRTFTFTLDGLYAVGSVQFAAKSKDDNVATISGPSCLIAAPAIEVEKNCVGDVFVGDTITYNLTVRNSGNVPLKNVSVTDPLLNLSITIPTLGVGAQWNQTGSIVPTAVGTITNTLGASGSYWNLVASGTDSCATNVHALNVSKTARTSYTRTWDWQFDVGTADTNAEICSGQTKTFNYTATASRNSVDSDFTARGEITVTNPAPIPAMIASITDDLAGQAIPVVCPSELPFTLAPDASVTCTYVAPLPNASSRLNVARATIANGTSFRGTAPVTFGDPSVEIDATASASFAVTCPEGFTCGTIAPLSFNAPGSAEFSLSVTNTAAMCDSNFTLGTAGTLVESTTGQARPDSVSSSIYTCKCSNGCTLTIGYWKTHAGFTGRNTDRVTQYLPKWLGTAFGPKSVNVTGAAQAVSILSMNLGEPSNGITKLYAQMLAAKLNIANGASSTDVDTAIADADAFLAANDHTVWSSLTRAQRNAVATWMSRFDNYNNGLIGPGHCD